MDKEAIREPEPYSPPIKFAQIQEEIYRGAYPRPINYRYLKLLNLKTMICLIPHQITMDTDASLFSFCQKNGIKLIHIECNFKNTKDKGKKRGIPIDHDAVTKIIEVIINSLNHPIYIFCNNGGQITSLVVACLRKLMNWNSVSIYNEFVTYSSAINHIDRDFIDSFKGELRITFNQEYRVAWLTNLEKTGNSVYKFIVAK